MPRVSTYDLNFARIRPRGSATSEIAYLGLGYAGIMHAHPASLSHDLGQRVLVCMPTLWGQWQQCLREAVPCKPDHCTFALARSLAHTQQQQTWGAAGGGA